MQKTYLKIRQRLKEETPAGCERPRITSVEALLCEEIDALSERVDRLLDKLSKVISNLNTSEHQE